MKRIDWQRLKADTSAAVGIVYDIIPLSYDEGRELDHAARQILGAILVKLVYAGWWNDKALDEVLTQPVAGVAAFLEGTTAEEHLDCDEQKAAAILGTLVHYLER